MAMPLGIQGQILEVTVVGCNNLKDTEWISRQDPYVCLEYGSTKFRTRTCTDGNKNPSFNEKFVFNLIEGLREINVYVWNSNTLSHDDFIASGKVLLTKVLSQGFDDSCWPIMTRRGRHGGEVKLILHYAGTQKQGKPGTAAAPYYPTPPYPSVPYAPSGQPSVPGYPPSSYPPPYSSYPPPPAATYPPPQTTYPPPPYPPPPSTYPPSTYPPTYPPQPYPPSTYPPQPYPPSQPPHPYPPATFPGVYPPPPSY